MAMEEVFVSYSHQDATPVATIVERLKGHGHSVWWDRRLLGGADFGPEIQQALSTSKCAVVAWSKAAQHSLWVRAEANDAREAHKLVQLTLDGTKPPLPFSMLHTLDFRSDDGSPNAQPMHELLISVEGVKSGTDSDPIVRKATMAPDLAGFGSTVIVGGASLGLVLLASALAGAASHLQSTNLFGFASTALFLFALLSFGHMLSRVVITFLASRRQ